MGTVWGMDIERVRQLATNFTTQSAAVVAVIDALDPDVQDESMWKGPDADGFRSEWETHKTNLRACADALEEASTKANNNANEQESTSQSL